MMATTIDRYGDIHTVFTSPLYTEHFRYWARLYVAVLIIEGEEHPVWEYVESAYGTATGRNPLIL